jgi:uncharacterized membrane protein
MDVPQRAPWRGRLVLAMVAALAVPGCDDGLPSELASGQPASVRLNLTAVQLLVGEDTTVIATLHDRTGQPVASPSAVFQVTWSSSDENVASVANGVIRAVGQGRASVTAAAASLPAAAVDIDVVSPGAVLDRYQAIALGRLGATQSNGWAINDAGVVAGWASVSGGRAFRWSEADGMTALPGISSSRGINSAGAIVGFFNHAGGFSAYVFHDGVRIDLQALDTGTNSDAYRINDAGTVVGRSATGRAVVWRRGADGSYGAPLALGYRNSNQSPVINGRGDIAFTAFDVSRTGLNEPVLWRIQPDGSYGDALFLGRPAGGSYFVRDINDAGQIVGFRWTGTIEMAVLWHPADYSAPIDLGIGEAWGINNHGWIVGGTGGNLPSLGGVPRRPALWVVDASRSVHGPYDIGTPAGFAYGAARAINDHGWITGSTWGPGEIMATLWRL